MTLVADLPRRWGIQTPCNLTLDPDFSKDWVLMANPKATKVNGWLAWFPGTDGIPLPSSLQFR